jgi:hypothetical protein
MGPSLQLRGIVRNAARDASQSGVAVSGSMPRKRAEDTSRSDFPRNINILAKMAR